MLKMILKKKIDGVVVKYKFLGITVVRVRKIDVFVEYKILGITIKRVLIPSNKNPSKEKSLELFSKKDIILFFDLSLGGGTESYFYNVLKSVRRNNNIIRFQYMNDLNIYKITYFEKENEYIVIVKNLHSFERKILKTELSEIVVNNLVSWPDTYAVLNLISRLKNENIFLSVRGHDYFPICPFFNLTKNGRFCGLPLGEGCEACFPLNKHDDIPVAPGIKINNWRDNWEYFFDKYVDELIVFSQSGYNLFIKTYPCLERKTKIILHDVPKLREVRSYINRNTKIKIGVLGNITRQSKGSDILNEMELYIDSEPNISLVVIGHYNKLSQRTTVIGEYNREELPEILENNEINIIFIPSVWPETFSYTTSEAIIMNIPVACFNLGAPAERVKQYEKGLVINEIDAKLAICEIKKFIEMGLKNGN
ncbi:glycosyltransferase [Pectobacterium carotovorum]|uniref:glycosyltransferase n=1 Tax=Pectobacterium carotovorum TaxID=554 RepID=UPI0010FEA178|nr:glycosyltransferase [Pectobacterium carotovorum]KAA3669518.1 glycosyltransferase family 4 protein [Pectobacterium carotovorum subsp. carotovorum]UCZ79396.1 glycosyltransferase [Pectobacterium carotovorum]